MKKYCKMFEFGKKKKEKEKIVALPIKSFEIQLSIFLYHYVI